MELAEAAGADELWGWPVEVLDRLLALQQRAWAGQVPLEAWRAEDASLRSGLPPVDSAAVGSALTDWVSSGALNLRDHGGLLGRLTVLANLPPSDEDLWAELGAATRRAEADGASPRFAEVDRARQELILSWLVRPGSGIDLVSGLPWSMVARCRVADDPSVELARRVALAAVDVEERRCAELVSSRAAELGVESGPPADYDA